MILYLRPVSQKPLTSKETISSIKVRLTLHPLNWCPSHLDHDLCFSWLSLLIAFPSHYTVYASLGLSYAPSHTCMELGPPLSQFPPQSPCTPATTQIAPLGLLQGLLLGLPSLPSWVELL